jgi:hypothetical protein
MLAEAILRLASDFHLTFKNVALANPGGVLEIASHREDLYLDRAAPAGVPPSVSLVGRRGWQESS